MKRGAILLSGLLWASPGPAAAEDALGEARALAENGQRAASLELLERRLAENPGDTDARVYYGTVLSWEKRYDEARRELDRVLADRPHHGDALPALINVELWSDHQARAEQLASEGLEQRPNDTGLLLARARALHKLERDGEAVDALDRILDLTPGDPEARSLWRSLKAKGRLWEVKTSYEGSWFSDQRSRWHEGQLDLKRRTKLGSLIGRYTYAKRFDQRDSLIELDFYPGLGRGTYAYLSAGYSPKAALFPEYRVAADLYRNLGGGFEASLGYRRLGFTNAVDIYTGSVGKYLGNWYFTARTYYKPDPLGASNSYHFSVRRFLGGDGKRYLDLRYGHGFFKEEARSLNEIAALGSDTVAGWIYYLMTDALGIEVKGSWSREERVARPDLSQYSASAGLIVRF